MPNWTYNRLAADGQPAALRTFLEAVRAEQSEGSGEPPVLSFERHPPTPREALADRGSPAEGRFPAWRDWRSEHWGTKWDAQWPQAVERGERSVTYSFATAWGPPDAWLAHVSRAHPDVTLRNEFCDELAHFAGRGVWRAGALAEEQPLDPYGLEWIEWEDEEQ